MMHSSLLFSLATAAATKHHGIVFDAGSSGTRIHVHTWQTGGGGAKDAFDLISDDLLKIKPGLSAFKDRPSEAGASLAPLIDYAKTKIPPEMISSTPMYLMATAGLRMVGEATKDAILASVCSYLKTTGFQFTCASATLLDGRDEGLYGWVTVCKRCCPVRLSVSEAPTQPTAQPNEPHAPIARTPSKCAASSFASRASRR